MENKNFFIVYCTINTRNKKQYIGIHKTENPDIFDGYLGNGCYSTIPSSYNREKTAFAKAIQKYGPKSFQRYTLKVYNTLEEALYLEAILVDKEYVKRRDTYNMIVGGGVSPNKIKEIFGNTIIDKEYYDRLISSYLENIPESAEEQQKDIYKDYIYREIEDYNKIYQYNAVTGNYETSYDSVIETAKALDTCCSLVSRAIRLNYKINNKYLSNFLTDKLPTTSHRRKYCKNIPIYQYDLEGNFLAEYKNQREAKSKLNFSTDYNLTQSCITGQARGGYLWSFDKVDKLEYKTKHIPICKRHKVGQYDIEGNLIKIYKSVTECQKDFPSVRNVLKGRTKQTKGFYFKYLD